MSLKQLILNGTAKTKLAILAFLCFGEFVKNSIGMKVFQFLVGCANVQFLSEKIFAMIADLRWQGPPSPFFSFFM